MRDILHEELKFEFLRNNWNIISPGTTKGSYGFFFSYL